MLAEQNKGYLWYLGAPMREIFSTTEEAQDECFLSLSAVTESPGSPAHGHVLHLARSCWCLHWAYQNPTNNCVCAAGWERVQRLCGALQMCRQVDVHVLSPMAHRKAGAGLQSKRRRERVMPTCGVQVEEVQWEPFNLDLYPAAPAHAECEQMALTGQN